METICESCWYKQAHKRGNKFAAKPKTYCGICKQVIGVDDSRFHIIKIIRDPSISYYHNHKAWRRRLLSSFHIDCFVNKYPEVFR